MVLTPRLLGSRLPADNRPKLCCGPESSVGCLVFTASQEPGAGAGRHNEADGGGERGREKTDAPSDHVPPASCPPSYHLH